MLRQDCSDGRFRAMQLEDVLQPETVLIDWDPSGKTDAIRLLINALFEEGYLSDYDQVLEDVLQREQSLSTGLEDGIAYPHARTKGVDRVCMAFGIVPDGLEFNSRDKQPAIFIPLMLSPKRGGNPHIYFMAEIVKQLEDRDVRERLLGADSPEEVYGILTGSG